MRARFVAYLLLIMVNSALAACGTGDPGVADAPVDSGVDSPPPDAGGGAGAACGLAVPTPCQDGLYCDWPQQTCGTGGGAGACAEKPASCDDTYEPICACDRHTYDNLCQAQAAGFDVTTDLTYCQRRPRNYFRCGYRFCPIGGTYCERTISASGAPDEYRCVPGQCIATETCRTCEAILYGEMLTCQGP